ncbi:MAG TPA: SigB/SigF/SigG family RNA polymerase sigma factor [Solirubrobacter sp.]|nr:SigB/SigF/SigG family RNA polymerase sigma factor [Solirubrobacter sp.]
MAPFDDTTQLFERYRSERDPRDREALVLRFLPLANSVAHRYNPGNEREDIEQVAALALINAIDRYDPARGAFVAYAVPTILGEIKRYFRDLGWSVHVPRALQELTGKVDAAVHQLTAELGRHPTAQETAERCRTTPERVVEARALRSAQRADSLDRPVNDEEEDETVVGQLGVEEPGYRRVERAVDFDRLLDQLPDRDREVLRLRFQEDLLQHQIASRLGISQMHVSRLLRQSLATVRTSFTPHAVGCRTPPV